MPYTPHIEQHFTGGLVVRDTVIGLSDGLTVPFALAAGLTGAIDSTALVVTAGLAEIAAGSIYGSMALLADGWHMATHAGALSVSAMAYAFARRRCSSSRGMISTRLQGRCRLSSWCTRISSQASRQAPGEPGRQKM